MSASGSFSKSSNDSQFQQEIPWYQQQNQQQFFDQANNWYGQNAGGVQDNFNNWYSGTQGGLDQNSISNATGAGASGMGAWNDQLQGGAYANGQNAYEGAGNAFQGAGNVYENMGLAKDLSSSLQQSMAGPSNSQEINNMIMGGEGNTYADAMKGQYIQDANRASQNMMGNLDARAAASGMSGGSRHGVATAQGMEDINRNLQNNMARTGFETFDKDLDRKLQIAGAADQNTLARQQMMQGMLGSQQGAQNFNNTGQQNAQNQNLSGQQGAYNFNTQGANSTSRNALGMQDMINQYTGMGSNAGMNSYNNQNTGVNNVYSMLSGLGGMFGGNDILSSGSASGKGIGMSQSAGIK